MLQVNEFAPHLTPEEETALLKLATANICDALYKAKVPRCGCLDAAVQPLENNMKFVGVAYTVKATNGNSLPVQCALKLAKPGYVMCVDTGSYTEGPYLGDLMALLAQKMGLAGVVIDGYIRDAAEIAASGFPVFCRGQMPRKPGKADEGEINGVVNCAGISITPGDVILGDRDGVVVIPRKLLATILPDAMQKSAGDDKRHQLIMNFFENNLHNQNQKDVLTLLSKEVQEIMGQ